MPEFLLQAEEPVCAAMMGQAVGGPWPEEPVTFSWDEILNASLLDGRRMSLPPFGNPFYFRWETQMRVSILRTTLNGGNVLRVSQDFRRMEATEKGAMTYFVGMTMSQLLAQRYLGCLGLLHVKIFENRLTVNALAGRSRPDLFGYSPIAQAWLIVEAKGRTTSATENAKLNAKAQCAWITHVGTNAVQHRFAVITGFYSRSQSPNRGRMRVWWRDPPITPAAGGDDGNGKQEPERGDLLAKRLSPRLYSWLHYRLRFGVARELGPNAETALSEGEPVNIPDADLSIRFDPTLWELLRRHAYNEVAKRFLFAEAPRRVMESRSSPSLRGPQSLTQNAKVFSCRTWTVN